MVLETVSVVKEKFKADHIVNILTGNANTAVKAYKHHKLETFGEGSEKDVRFWNAIMRQTMVMKYLDKDIDSYGMLLLTEKGRDFLAKPYDVMFTQDHEYEEAEDDDTGYPTAGKTGAVDEELFNMLKDLRKKVSKKKSLPPFVIFQDPSLEDMSIQYPITIEELQNISGVGTGKAKRYGKEFIDLIKSYVDDKEIIRPQDMVVKSIANKSLLKVYVIQSIDRKMDLDDIAGAKNLEMAELLNEIEAIVNSGTKINIDYYIDKTIEEEKREEIFNYFQEHAETESIEEALKYLGEEDFNEEEIRLIRIKFLSELGN
jgi:ATP-dependent DNA helicase RecQ